MGGLSRIDDLIRFWSLFRLILLYVSLLDDYIIEPVNIIRHLNYFFS